MLRNWVVKLPGIKGREKALSSICLQRSARSLSPVSGFGASRLQMSVLDSNQSLHLRSRSYSKDYYKKESRKKWRDTPKREAIEEETVRGEHPKFEPSVEQYELEAARPRPPRKRDLIEAFISNSEKESYSHLQPSRMRPYGSCNHYYAPSLLRPTSLIYPKTLKGTVPRPIGANEPDQPTKNSFGYSENVPRRYLSTSVSCIGKLALEDREEVEQKIPRSRYHEQIEHWAAPPKINLSPPKFQAVSNDEDNFRVDKNSTETMRRERQIRENEAASLEYKSSYSDVIKQKLNERTKALDLEPVKKAGSIKSLNSNKMLDAFNSLPGKRTMASQSVPPKGNNGNSKKPPNPECEDICSAVIKALPKKEPRRYPLEPPSCEPEKPPSKKVYLPSKVRLPVPICTPRPNYDCKPAKICPERADDCQEIKPKRLPKLVPSNCPCIEQPPPVEPPALKRLDLRVPEPLKICKVEEPCIKKIREREPVVKKKLPKLIPRDCPCEDREMIDWNVKRLHCVDEEQECIVPDPCLQFPRADWGCWEYSQEECKEVDEKCLPIDPCAKPEEKKPASQHRYVCKGSGKQCHTSNRKFSNKASVNLPQKVEAAPNVLLKGVKKPSDNSVQQVLNMIKLLDNPDEPLEKLVDPLKSSRLEGEVHNKGPLMKTLSRRISTSQNELETKKEKSNQAKRQCKKITSSSKHMCKKKATACLKLKVCHNPVQEHRPSCKKERIPVCCQKLEAPHSAFSEQLSDYYPPFSTEKEWTCNRPQYGFNPVYNKEQKPCKPKKKEDKKSFCTLSLLAGLPQDLPVPKIAFEYQGHFREPNSRSVPELFSSKDYLRKPFLAASPSQYRHFSTIIFKITQPESCNKPSEDTKTCDNPPAKPLTPIDLCKAVPRVCSHVAIYKKPPKRKPPPFPAFSDCLNEEMEDILSECPLDRDKYLIVQPRHTPAHHIPSVLAPVEPVQGKIDYFKEEECVRERLCLPKDGLTQTCKDFGKPVRLLKARVLQEEDRDCKRIEELKKMGRWPDQNLKRNFTTVTCSSKRDYHALVKGVHKAVFGTTHEKLKETIQKVAPNAEDHEKFQKRIILNRQSGVAKSASRCYCTFKTRRSFRKKLFQSPCRKYRSRRTAAKFTLKGTTFSDPKSSLFHVRKEFPKRQTVGGTPGSKQSITVGCDPFRNTKKDKNGSTTVVECFVQNHKGFECPEEPDVCTTPQNMSENTNACIQECLNSIPEEEKFCVCSNFPRDDIPMPEKKLTSVRDIKIPKCPKLKRICSTKPVKVEIKYSKQVQSSISECPKIKNPCKDVAIALPAPKPKKCSTQLEAIWQKVVTYFKARPNCPEPGDYKKKALKEKAEKAASALGLVVIDPKCLPPEIQKGLKAPKMECNCTSKSSGSKPGSPEANSTRNFSTNFQPSRNYSSSKNLEEINRMLREAELKRDDTKKAFRGLAECQKDPEASRALKMALDLKLRKCVNFRDLCSKNEYCPKTYFGYSNITPSRENILERAWRPPVGSSNYPTVYDVSQFLSRIKKRVKSVEDLEKMKTENLLRELDEFLQCKKKK